MLGACTTEARASKSSCEVCKEDNSPMKQMQITVLVLAVVLCGASAFAQHGHGLGPGMNPAMGEGSSHRMSPNGPTAGSSTHRMTMDQQLTKNTALAGKIKTLTGM